MPSASSASPERNQPRGAAVAERDGSFVLHDVPPGAYRAVVQAGGERTEHRVDIAPSATELTLDASN